MNLKFKKYKSLTVAAFATVMLLPLGSCSSDPEADESVQGGDPVEAKFSARIAAPVTRASGTMWEDEDKIGIFMLSAGGDLTSGDDVLANNFLYTVDLTSAGGNPVADAASYLNPGATGSVYMQPGVIYDFVAYYPYVTPLTDDYYYSIDLADQTAGSAAHDLLYATSSRTNVKSDLVSFEFSHVLSKITINVTRGKGVTIGDYSSKTVAISGMPTTGVFDLSDATLNDLDDVDDIEFSKSDDDGDLYEVIVLPQAAGVYSGRTINFDVNGQEYYWAIPSGFAFEAGKRYTYTFKLTAGGLELAGDVEIDDWNDGGELDEGAWGKGVEELATIETVTIPAGSFLMGSSVTARTDEQPTHTVNITTGFKMSTYQITVAQYCEFLNDNAGEFTSSATEAKATLTGTDEHGQAYNYADVQLAKVDALTIKYEGAKWLPQDGRDDYPMAFVTWYGAFAFANWAGGRLPTEAEWEYASKAGSAQIAEADNYGMGVTGVEDLTPVQITAANLGDYAWFTGNNTPETGDGYAAGAKPVGLKLPNVWGLYDMHGNVWEWCYDWHNATYYTSATVSDPVNTATASIRVYRGGSFNYSATFCRSAVRSDDAPTLTYASIGFRVVFPL